MILFVIFRFSALKCLLTLLKMVSIRVHIYTCSLFLCLWTLMTLWIGLILFSVWSCSLIDRPFMFCLKLFLNEKSVSMMCKWAVGCVYHIFRILILCCRYRSYSELELQLKTLNECTHYSMSTYMFGDLYWSTIVHSYMYVHCTIVHSFVCVFVKGNVKTADLHHTDSGCILS